MIDGGKEIILYAQSSCVQVNAIFASHKRNAQVYFALGWHHLLDSFRGIQLRNEL
jgi:hypothetical protein